MIGSLSVRTGADTGCFPVGRVSVSIAALAVAVCVCVSLALTVATVAFRGMCVIFVVVLPAACSLACARGVWVVCAGWAGGVGVVVRVAVAGPVSIISRVGVDRCVV